jgi:hypothetical protein
MCTTQCFAVETFRGVVRESAGSFCSLGCSQFYLEPDPAYERVSLQGNFSLYLNQHVQVTGFRDLCSGCFVFVLTETVIVLPPLVPVNEGDPFIPREVRLFQNYPNPFNPSTEITFTLPEKSNIELKIFNLLGEEKDVLVNNDVEPGEHRTRWNPEHLPGGVYFCRLMVKNQHRSEILIRRMMLLR